ncbi:hypothetical protein EB796_020809 [Bugula neritina]|uniref:GST N-terminal domain-containing protein n=1 Tax=Bugula neritina TaxID=10212 RepID=A0A7J7J5A2_BUGNE|nr:hypothetical protein EB796_020809 [Bugula neritina]
MLTEPRMTNIVMATVWLQSLLCHCNTVEDDIAKFQTSHDCWLPFNASHSTFTLLRASSIFIVVVKMAEMKLTYFNGRGRAELTRLLFTQAKRSFTDCRVEGEEWTKLKPCLFGSSNLEAAVCDMMIESVNDILLICVDRMFKAKTEEEKVKLAMTVIDRACRL